MLMCFGSMETFSTQWRKGAKFSLLDLQAVYHSVNAVFKQYFAKIYDKAKLQFTYAQIGEQLRFKNRMVLAGRLALDDDQIPDEQIDAQRVRQPYSLVVHRKRHLPLHIHLLLGKSYPRASS